jgi:hypothetical protein
VTAPAQAPAPRDSTGPSLVAGGAAAAVLGVVAALDQFLVAHGELGANMMQKLGPLLAPLWGNAPLLMLLVGLAWWAGKRWTEGQTARAAEAAALSGQVGDVASGLAGLRTEVHELRGALQDHADATDARLRDHDAGLRAVQADVSQIGRRVDVLERPAVKRRTARA